MPQGLTHGHRTIALGCPVLEGLTQQAEDQANHATHKPAERCCESPEDMPQDHNQRDNHSAPFPLRTRPR